MRISDFLFSLLMVIIALFLWIIAVVILIRKWKELSLIMKVSLLAMIILLTVYLLFSISLTMAGQSIL